MRKLIIAWMITSGVILGVHAWQDALQEDARWIDSCHTMGNGLCGPQQPWITVGVPDAWR